MHACQPKQSKQATHCYLVRADSKAWLCPKYIYVLAATWTILLPKQTNQSWLL
jgi:hypothetical protein